MRDHAARDLGVHGQIIEDALVPVEGVHRRGQHQRPGSELAHTAAHALADQTWRVASHTLEGEASLGFCLNTGIEQRPR